MSYPIDYSLISTSKADFDNYYDTCIKSNNPSVVETAIQLMSDLAENINTTLASAPPYVAGYFNWITQVRTEDKQKIINDVQEKLASMFSHSTKISPPPLTGRAEPILPPQKLTPPPVAPQSNPPIQNAKTNAVDYAVGFCNMSNNCWANALLSMIVCIPSLRQAYDTVANHYAQGKKGELERKYGVMLQEALKSYETALVKKQAVLPQVSQDVRVVFNAFFGRIGPNGNEIFSTSSAAQEDAYEALQMLMGKYEQVIRQENPQNPAFSDLYCPLETKRHYRPIGEQSDIIPNNPSQLGPDSASRLWCNDYQILLDMQNKNHLSFSALLSSFFRNTDVEGYEPGRYLLPNGKMQNFKLIGEGRQFANVPSEFILTIKRFGSNNYGHGFKITTPTAISQMIALPREATKENKPITYELDAFIVHSGGTSGGHYICYKKIEGRWIEANDSNVRFVESWEIDQILQGQKGAHFTSYVHHYSRAVRPQGMEALAASNNTDSLSAELLARTDAGKYTQQRLDTQATIKSLEDLLPKIEKDPDCLKNVPLNVLSTLRHAIWLNDKTPDIADYGTTELKKNPKKLIEIQFPWLIGHKGTTLLDQMLIIQKKKLEIASEQLSEALLQVFIAKLKNTACSNEELLLAFQTLPEATRHKLQEFIYLAHKIKFGGDHVHKREYKNDYGRFALSGGDLRKTLTEARESVLNLFGNNIVEQLAASHRIKAEKLQYAYEKEQLQAFRELLVHYPSQDLTANQLAKAFERLEISNTIRERIYRAIWVAHKELPIANYGGNTLAANPRCLLAINAPILAEPPLCAPGSDILQQMIALLEIS